MTTDLTTDERAELEDLRFWKAAFPKLKFLRFDQAPVSIWAFPSTVKFVTEAINQRFHVRALQKDIDNLEQEIRNLKRSNRALRKNAGYSHHGDALRTRKIDEILKAVDRLAERMPA